MRHTASGAARSGTVLALILGLTVAAYAQAMQRYDVKIAAQPADMALKELAQQTGLQVLVLSNDAYGKRSQGVQGNLTGEEALTALLRGTGLIYQRIDERTVTVVKRREAREPEEPTSPNSDEGAEIDHRSPSPEREPENSGLRAYQPTAGVPEVLVKGSKVLNMDIKRSRDDVQPYAIFDRARIQQSGAADIEEFLKQRLPMNALAFSGSQVATAVAGNMSRINLRGLGLSQTLILVDGHRMVTPSLLGTPQQPDLNGIPLAAVERIEVLPTTASGIYGGSATGGVVNIILRRDYTGTELKATYGNSFDTDSALRRMDLNTGFNLESGRTNVLLAGSYSDQGALIVRDRDLVQRSRAAILQNNPGFFLNAANPPLGATPNIRSVNGSPLFGPGTPAFTSVPAGYTGGGGLAPLQANAGQYNFDLADTAHSFSGGGGGASLLNGPTIESLMATIRRQFGTRVDVFLEMAASNNEGRSIANLESGTFTLPPTAPNNPFGQAIRVTVPVPQADGGFLAENRDRRLLGGVIVQLPRDWRAEADYTWNRSSFVGSSPGTTVATVSAAVGTGALDVLRDPAAAPVDFAPYLNPPGYNTPYRTVLKDATLRLAGPIGSLPAGPVTISGLLERREERLSDSYQFVSPTRTLFVPHRSQSVDSAYLEIQAPLVSVRNSRRGVRELELQVAARRDHYTTEGSGQTVLETPTSTLRAENKLGSTNPTVGFRYQPVQDVTLRASYGTGFLAPAVNQLVPNAPAISTGTLIDTRRNNELVGPRQVVAGGNPGLGPEESESWSAGVVVTPRFLPQVRLSVDYTRIDKSDNVLFPSQQQLVDNESLFPERIIRGPVPPGDPFGVGRITSIDATQVNISEARIEAYDVALDYRATTTRFGTVDFFAVGTWQVHFQTQLVPTAPVVENVGINSFSSIPLKLKGNAGLTWRHKAWTASWMTRYFDSYLVADPALASSVVAILNQGSLRVPSQTYHDVSASYRFGSDAERSVFGSELLNDVEVQLGVRNVFNSRPPFDAGGGASNPYSYSYFGDPRLANYYVSLKLSF